MSLNHRGSNSKTLKIRTISNSVLKGSMLVLVCPNFYLIWYYADDARTGAKYKQGSTTKAMESFRRQQAAHSCRS